MNKTIKIKNLTEMSVNRAILYMALPASCTMMIELLYYVVDTYWIGKLGAEALAAASASQAGALSNLGQQFLQSYLARPNIDPALAAMATGK